MKVVLNCSVCLICLILCGCHKEQSYHINKKRYFVPLEGLIDLANSPDTTDGKHEQEQAERYAQVVYDAQDYVHKHSTERMKQYISRGQLVVGMNQKEVLACLHAAHYRDGLPVPSRTFNSKYGKYETWIVGGSSGGTYSSPRYALDFNCFILTSIHVPLDELVKSLSDTETSGSNDKYFKDAYAAMGRMYHVSHSLEDKYEGL